MIVPLFKGKGDVWSCGSYVGVKLLEHATNIVERMLERLIRTLINFIRKQFEFTPEKGRVDTLFVERRNIKRQERSCACILLTWKRHLM